MRRKLGPQTRGLRSEKGCRPELYHSLSLLYTPSQAPLRLYIVGPSHCNFCLKSLIMGIKIFFCNYVSSIGVSQELGDNRVSHMKLCFHIWVYAFVLSRGTLCASVCEGKVAPSPFGLDRAEASALSIMIMIDGDDVDDQ